MKTYKCFTLSKVMEVELTKDATEEIERVSILLGMQTQEIIRRAIIVYLDEIQKFVELKKEFDAWDTASDEALERFERKV